MFVASILISKIIPLTDANFKTLTLYLSKKFKSFAGTKISNSKLCVRIGSFHSKATK